MMPVKHRPLTSSLHQQRLVHQNQGLVGIAIGEVNISLKKQRPQETRIWGNKQTIWISLRIQHDDDDDDGGDDDDDDDDDEDDDYDDDDDDHYSCYTFTKLPNLFFHVPHCPDALFLPTFANSMLK